MALSRAELNENEYIQMIAIEEIKQFCILALQTFGSEQKLLKAQMVAKITIGMLKKQKLITEHSHQAFVDILIAAALLHNLFYVKSKWLSIFEAREKLTPIASEIKLHENVANGIFESIEAQKGVDSEVSRCAPNSNTPQELLMWAVWFANTYLDEEAA